MNDKIQMNDEQISLVKAGVRRIETLAKAYTQAAIRRGEIHDQLKTAEEEESKARLLLREAEMEHANTVNEIATELGHNPTDRWQYNNNDFSFTAVIDPPEGPKPNNE